MSKQSDLVSVSQGASGDPLFIDTENNRVGVGTSLPLARLQASTAGTSTTPNTNVVARFVTNGSDADAHIQLSNGVDHSANIGIAGGANLYFATDGAERMRIDSAGRVTMPYQPSFWAQLTTNYTQGVVTSYSIGTSNGFSILVRHNVGNHYNSSTGVFTAPVAGVYVFGINDLCHAGTGYILSGITINSGAATAYKYTDSTGTVYDATATTITVSLAANDTATFFVTSNNSAAFLNGGGYNSMFGYLLG